MVRKLVFSKSEKSRCDRREISHLWPSHYRNNFDQHCKPDQKDRKPTWTCSRHKTLALHTLPLRFRQNSHATTTICRLLDGLSVDEEACELEEGSGGGPAGRNSRYGVGGGGGGGGITRVMYHRTYPETGADDRKRSNHEQVDSFDLGGAKDSILSSPRKALPRSFDSRQAQRDL